MRTEKVLLSWEELCALPAMRKRSGRGGRGAWLKQRELREMCFRNHMRQFDLSVGAYDWRLLLKTMMLKTTLAYQGLVHTIVAYDWRQLLKTVIGRGVISFQFRLLDLIDDNYRLPQERMRTAYAPWDRYESQVEDRGERHVFELCCADGIRWHMHFHRNGSCDLMRRSHWCDN